MKDVLKLALEALEMHVPHVYKDRGYGPITAIKEALAQPEKGLFIDLIAQHEGLAEELAQPEQPEQEPKKRCCNHDSDCAVHNGDALPVGPCNCTQTFVSSPDLGIVATVSYQLAVRELAKLVENNFGYMPRNDEWADKVLLVRDTFEAAHSIKELNT